MIPGTTMNGQKYLELLHDRDSPVYTLWQHIYVWWYLMPLSKESARIFLKGQGDYVGVAWQQPNLNQIEHLWDPMKNKVADKQPAIGKTCVNALKDIWTTGVSAEDCQIS